MTARALSAAERARKPATWVLALAWLGAIAASRSVWPAHDALHEAIEEAGALLIGACIVGRLFCSLYIGGRKDAVLVTQGPYSVTRNPLYLFSLAGAGGLGLSSGSLALGVLFAAAYFMALSGAVQGEERRLSRAFGEAYALYLRRVPRWLPDFALWRDAEAVSVDPALIRRRLAEAAGLLLAMPLIEALEHLHETGVLPAVLALP